MDIDTARRHFRAVATVVGADPDLALARAQQVERDNDDVDVAEAYLAVLAELCDGRV